MMNWNDWEDGAFLEARATRRPVLLFITAAWCRWCKQLERDVLQSPEVAALLSERFVLIRVDKDKRPDLDARYARGGWPTIAYLDDEGCALAADNYMDAPALLTRLRMVAETYEEKRESIQELLASRAERPTTVDTPGRPLVKSAAQPRELTAEVIEHSTQTLLRTADREYGGWGRTQKFPHPEAIDFALLRWSQTGSADLLELVRRTLRHMQAGEIHDPVEGGFYRYATRNDWSVPHHEKMLDSNAQRADAYLEAHQALGEESWRGTAEGVLNWLQATLYDSEHRCFYGSQDADSAYANISTRAGRSSYGAPPRDETIYANWNAMTASTFLHAHGVLGEASYARTALDTLDFLWTELFDAEKGICHYYDTAPHLPRHLSDQAYTLRAFVDAAQYTGETRYLAHARELADWTLEHLRSPDGSFYDTPHNPRARGNLKKRDRSILENAVLAEALLRLSQMTWVPDYADIAREALTAFGDTYKAYGHYTAGYARAVDLLLNAPVHVAVIGSYGDPRSHDLLHAALKPYVASRVVQLIDPQRDPDLLTRSGLPAHTDHPTAYIARGRESYAETTSPTALPGLMTRT
jgi:hypothetical protein